MPKRITPQEYKERFNTLYPDYELLSDYNGDKNYIEVRCKKDGNVWKTKPNWLKQGIGCKACYYKRRGDALRKSNDKNILNSIDLYTKENTATNLTELLSLIEKHKNIETLFEGIVKNVIN